MNKILALLFVLCAVPAWAQQPVTAVNLPTCAVASCSPTSAVPQIAVDAVTGLPLEFAPIDQTDTPNDAAGSGQTVLCRGQTYPADGASVDDSLVKVGCTQSGELFIAPGTPTLIRSDNTNNDDETQICAGPCVVTRISGRNASASVDAYIRCTNLTAANTTPGSSTVVYEITAPFASSFADNMGNGGMKMTTAFTCYIATGKAVSDATDAAQDDVVVNVLAR